MTIEELKALPLWKILSPAIRKTLEEAQRLGWELHGKGATIAFRLDRDQDELDMPAYVMWNIGVTPKGGLSMAGGKAGVPHMTMNTTEFMDYLEDPSTVYPLEDEPAEATTSPEDAEELPPWDTTRPVTEYITDRLGATELSDKPAPRPLRVSPASSGSSSTTAPTPDGTTATGIPSSVPSTATAKPAAATTRPLRVSVATVAK